MAITTLTLSANGRLPGALSAAPSALSRIVIASGVVAIMPHATSGFACHSLSCLGFGYNRGRIGVPSNAGEPSGTIVMAGTSGGGTFMFASVGNMERNTGQTFIPKGGGVGTA